MTRILFIGLVWPEPNSSAAGWRMVHLITLFLQRYEVHFASAASKTPFSHRLEALGVIEHTIILNDSSFDTFLKELNPMAVIFDRFMIEEQYAWRVATYLPSALRILDTEDLHFLRKARKEAYMNKKEIDFNNDYTKRELASILRSDVSLIISEFEQKLLEQKFGIAKDRLLYLPFQETPLNTPIVRKSFDEREHFIFIGNFIHEPNWRTVEILKYSIWPKLRKKLPKVELHIYGAYVSEKVNQLNNPSERFIIKGRAENARETLEHYRLLLAPIPFGAGVKGKFVDTMFAGTPTITTSIGAEDIVFEDNWPGYIIDNIEEVVDKAVELYTDNALWLRYQSIGFHIFNSTFSDNSYSQSFLNWLDYARDNWHSIRNDNFIGQVLLQQQFNATKYMALWIEEKNKKVI